MNNKGLIYFETDEKSLAIINFQKAILIEENPEPMLALAVSLQDRSPKESVLLAKKALKKNPNYVSIKYRKDQLTSGRYNLKTTKKSRSINSVLTV